MTARRVTWWIAAAAVALTSAFAFSTVTQFATRSLSCDEHLPAATVVPPPNAVALRDSLVRLVAQEYGVRPQLALALARVENPWADPSVVSHAGAVGLLQVMPPELLRPAAAARSRAALIRSICGVLPLTNPGCNVRVGLAIYRGYLDQHGNEELALCGYHGSLRYRVSCLKYLQAVNRHLVRVGDD